jgi:hypothetical protein
MRDPRAARGGAATAAAAAAALALLLAARGAAAAAPRRRMRDAVGADFFYPHFNSTAGLRFNGDAGTSSCDDGGP